MQIQVVDGYITGLATVGGFGGGIEVPESVAEAIEPEKMGFYRWANGAAVYDAEKHAAELKERQADEIREQRKAICFPIINRGLLWYYSLSDAHYEELLTWYKDWLDAPATLTVPDTPEWITS